MKSSNSPINHGVRGCAVFMLSFQGILVFLSVSQITKDTVFVCEIDTYPVEDGYCMISYDKIKKEYCKKWEGERLIIPQDADNTFYGKALEIKPILQNGEYYLPIDIRYGDRIMILAEQINRGKCDLLPSTYLAKMVCDGSGKSIKKLLNTKFRSEKAITDWRSQHQA